MDPLVDGRCDCYGYMFLFALRHVSLGVYSSLSYHLIGLR